MLYGHLEENRAISPEQAKSEQQDADAAKVGAITLENAAKITGEGASHAARILHERANQQGKSGREA